MVIIIRKKIIIRTSPVNTMTYSGFQNHSWIFTLQVCTCSLQETQVSDIEHMRSLCERVKTSIFNPVAIIMNTIPSIMHTDWVGPDLFFRMPDIRPDYCRMSGFFLPDNRISGRVIRHCRISGPTLIYYVWIYTIHSKKFDEHIYFV